MLKAPPGGKPRKQRNVVADALGERAAKPAAKRKSPFRAGMAEDDAPRWAGKLGTYNETWQTEKSGRFSGTVPQRR